MIVRCLCISFCLLPLFSSLAGAQELPWYRTTLPKITPERWTQAAPPIPEPAQITREDYLQYIKDKWLGTRANALAVKGKPDADSAVALRDVRRLHVPGAPTTSSTPSAPWSSSRATTSTAPRAPARTQ